jgi:general secretion pathway protein G
MRTHKSGFTLVEILIVVIILGILAAIVIPQFTNASQDARRSSLVSQLQTLRSQIELWKLQHGDALPNLVGGVDGANPDTSNWNPLTTVTQFNGVNFGPYMQAPPRNPLNNLGAVADGDGTAAAAAACGFIYDYNGGAGTGRIWGTDVDGLTVFVE